MLGIEACRIFHRNAGTHRIKNINIPPYSGLDGRVYQHSFAVNLFKRPLVEAGLKLTNLFMHLGLRHAEQRGGLTFLLDLPIHIEAFGPDNLI
ncbi:hypothetical protein J6590_083146 [Homalodisca vitripennis]|nr:hypothetical protein J6590_083146 [Homalodisca vitripennis]